MPASSGCRWRKASATNAAASATLPTRRKTPTTSANSRKSSATSSDGETRTFTEEDPITHQPIQRERVVSKIFDNEDFGYHKITVERPLRLNFQASAERIARLDDESGFKNLATSARRKRQPSASRKSKPGQQRQEEIRELLQTFSEATQRKALQRTARNSSTELRELDRVARRAP